MLGHKRRGTMHWLVRNLSDDTPQLFEKNIQTNNHYPAEDRQLRNELI